VALRNARRFEEAIAAPQDAAVIFRETGDRHREGMALNNLGLALREVRRFDDAVTTHQEAAVAFSAAGDQDAADEALQNAELVRSAQQD
jgi:tetratricopeptide (TPR) repeat protein